MNEIHLLLDETAVAYPTRNKCWKIFDVLKLTTIREIPALSDLTVSGTRHGSRKHIIEMGEYTNNEFADIEQGDIVVDVGAFIGSFTMYAIENGAEQVVAIDPNASLSGILSRNMSECESVTVVPKAAWNTTDVLEINQSLYPTENSVLSPDNSPLKESFSVQADTVPNIVRDSGFNRIDYLKVEAEGVEPEILEGALADDMPIDRIGVNTGAERYGEPVTDEVVEILEDHGYEYDIGDQTATVYGKQPLDRAEPED